MNKKNLTFESALGELETLVNKLESGQINLEDTISAYSRGKELKEFCQKKLSEAKLKVEKIITE